MDFAVAKEKDRFQSSLLGEDLEAFRGLPRREDGPTCRVSTAQPDGCIEVRLMVGMRAGENSEHDVSIVLHLSKDRKTQGCCKQHTLKATIAVDFCIQAVCCGSSAKMTVN